MLQRYGNPAGFSKVETLSGPVESHCRASGLAGPAEIPYFCGVMRIAGRILYWLAAVALVAAILASLDYSPAQAVLVGLIFCPCALALEYLMPKARRPIDKVYLSLAVLVSVILLVLILHFSVWVTLNGEGYSLPEKEVAPMLVNPAFLGLVLTALAIGDYFWAKWLSARFKTKGRTVTFFSERKSVTLPVDEIAYVESNDTEVRIVTRTGDAFRNKTGISQWENLLGDGFLRIHRSYLVNVSLAALSAPDTVLAAGKELPVSRKYKETVKAALQEG